MENLKQLQEDFQRFLLTHDHGMDDQVIGDERVDARTRLELYGDSYWLRLMEALEDTYPGLHTLLGDEEFLRAGRAYIDAHPSSYRSIRWFGDRMAEFMRNNAPWSGETILGEMAELEWVRTLVFDAAEAPVVGEEDMASVPPQAWGELTFTLHPSVHRLDLEWNVNAIRREVEKDEEPPAPEKGEYPVPWLLWRKSDYQTWWRSMDVDEAVAFDTLAEGGNFADISESILEWVDAENAPLRVAGMLKRWLNDELISELVINDQE